MAEQQDRQRAVEQAISQIEKQFGRGSIMKMDVDKVLDIPVISTGSLALDLALGIGGVPRGRVVEIYGPEVVRQDHPGASHRQPRPRPPEVWSPSSTPSTRWT